MKFKGLFITIFALAIASNVLSVKETPIPVDPNQQKTPVAPTPVTSTPIPVDPNQQQTPVAPTPVTSTPIPVNPNQQQTPVAPTPVAPTPTVATPTATTPVAPEPTTAQPAVPTDPAHILAKPKPIGMPNPFSITPDAQQCVDRAIAKILKFEGNCISKRSKPNDKICRKYRIRDSCRRKGDRKARRWTKKCGAPVILMRTMDAAPEDCRLCAFRAEGANKVLQNCLPPYVGSNACKAWIYRQRVVKCYQDKFKRFSEICGDKNLAVLDVKIGKRPKKCVEMNPDQCEKFAKKRIEKYFN